MMNVRLIPENAPFTPSQRAWLNGFLAGVLSLDDNVQQADMTGREAHTSSQVDAEDFPWHDPLMLLEERMQLAEGQPFEQVLMAAMGQEDCGRCGYDCKSYAKAIAGGVEKDLSLCAPGGNPTRKKLKELLANRGSVQGPPLQKERLKDNSLAPGTRYNRKNPFPARVRCVAPLNKKGSIKDTCGIVIDLSGSGITYQPGDSLGVYGQNSPELVSAVLERFDMRGHEVAAGCDGQTVTAQEALQKRCDITKPSDELLALLASCATVNSEAERLVELAEESVEEGTDVLDLLDEFPSARPRFNAFLEALGRLQPRLYSISSSLKAHPEEAHLTVGVVRYEKGKRARLGVASTYLAERVNGHPIRVFVQPAHDFHLPKNGDAPIIMVGPGTGVAPFRAFLEERRASDARGKNWLIFGNPNRDCDFLYREELENYLREGVLTRLDIAFSRDQQSKIYVQRRMLENAEAFWAWLQAGAYFYLCGDAKRMARDVDQALHELVAQQGQMCKADAKTYVKRLVRDKRYLKDVY